LVQKPLLLETGKAHNLVVLGYCEAP
jgi:hypothetical protein